LLLRLRASRGDPTALLWHGLLEAPRAAGVRVWQIPSGAGGHPGGDRRRSVLMLTIL